VVARARRNRAPCAVRHRIDVLLREIRPPLLGAGYRLHGVAVPIGKRRRDAIEHLQLACFGEGQANQNMVGIRVEIKDLGHGSNSGNVIKCRDAVPFAQHRQGWHWY